MTHDQTKLMADNARLREALIVNNNAVYEAEKTLMDMITHIQTVERRLVRARASAARTLAELP